MLAPDPRGGHGRRGEALRPDVWVVRPWDRPRGGGEVGRACRSPEGSRRAGNPCGMTGGRPRSARYPRRRVLRGGRGPVARRRIRVRGSWRDVSKGWRVFLGVWRSGARDQGHAEGWCVTRAPCQSPRAVARGEDHSINKYLLSAYWMPE